MAHCRIELSSLAPFDPLSDPTSLGPRWKAWRRRFETYITALGLMLPRREPFFSVRQDKIPRTSLILWPTLVKPIITKRPRTNLMNISPQGKMWTMKFSSFAPQCSCQMKQLTSSLPVYANSHRHAVSLTLTSKSAIIQHCTSKRLQRYAFLETDVSLANLLAKARALEASEIHATGISSDTDS